MSTVNVQFKEYLKTVHSASILINDITPARDSHRPSVECMRRILSALEEPVDILNYVHEPGPWNWRVLKVIFDKFDFFSQEVWLSYHSDLANWKDHDFNIHLSEALEFWRILCDAYESKEFEEDEELVHQIVAELNMNVYDPHV